MKRSEMTNTLQRLVRWVDDGKHLPSWLRDFHDQKDVFKACEDILGRPESGSGRDGITWVDGHIFTIDRFLRFMALHGYTLRRTWSDAPRIADTVEECRKARSAEFYAALKARREANAALTGGEAVPSNGVVGESE